MPLRACAWLIVTTLVQVSSSVSTEHRKYVCHNSCKYVLLGEPRRSKMV